jgi:hypothetical protein
MDSPVANKHGKHATALRHHFAADALQADSFAYVDAQRYAAEHVLEQDRG